MYKLTLHVMNTISLTHSHFLRYFMSYAACAGPEVIPPVSGNTSGFGQYQASSAALAVKNFNTVAQVQVGMYPGF